MKRKHTLATAIAVAATLTAGAELFNIKTGPLTYTIPAEECGEMVFTADRTLSLPWGNFDLGKITEMTVDDAEYQANTVSIRFDGDNASATIDGRLAQYVEVSISGGHVAVTQSDGVGDTTTGEITYTLSGASADASFTLDGAYKASVELNGVELTNPSGAAVDINNGKRIKLKVNGDNTLTDGAGGQKGCIDCKGHLEIGGTGSLTLRGNAAHAIHAKEYVTLKEATITVGSAVKDGINCNQYFAMKSGAVSILAAGDDGIQVSFKDDTNREAEDTGAITIGGGKIEITTSAKASKAMKAAGDITISGGEMTATVSGGGEWNQDESKTKAASCISASGNITLAGGTLELTATGSGGKGISADGTLTVEGGTTSVTTTGGVFAYVNGKEYSDYTGNLDYISTNLKSSPKGIKIDGDIVINEGTVTVRVSGNGGEGIESKALLTINGGSVNVKAYDDAINSSSHMKINGGEVTAVSTDNDGLDSNGNLCIGGGTVLAFGARSPECGLDANSEEGYTVIITGGNILAAGGGNSTPTTDASTQPYVSPSLTVTANQTVTISEGTTVLASFTVPDTYESSGDSSSGGWGGGGGWGGWGGGPGGQGGGMLISSPLLKTGSSYTVSNGSTSASASAVLKGGSSRPW